MTSAGPRPDGAGPIRSIAALFKLLRPHQWVKNVFVAAPLVFARHLADWDYVVRTGLAMLAFCALSGAVYAFNDVRDAEADRAHPTKRNRPIAAGKISERAGLVTAVVLAAAALAGCALLHWKVAAFAGAYLLQNILYSIKLKQVAFLDVGLITTGFLLRVLAGAAAIGVPASGWVLLCTALLAMLLGFGKRAHELAWAERSGQAATTRAALAGYRLGILRAALLVLAVATCATYAAYTLAPHTRASFQTDYLVISSPFVALGIARYLTLALWRPKDESPTEAMLRDPLFLIVLAATVGTILYLIYV